VRVKGGVVTKRRHKKILKIAKGYRGARSRRFRAANEAVMHALVYSYCDRKKRKRDFRRLWNIRISAGVKKLGFSYSKFIGGLHKAGILLNRKILSDLAVKDEKAFNHIVEIAKAHI